MSTQETGLCRRCGEAKEPTRVKSRYCRRCDKTVNSGNKVKKPARPVVQRPAQVDTSAARALIEAAPVDVVWTFSEFANLVGGTAIVNAAFDQLLVERAVDGDHYVVVRIV